MQIRELHFYLLTPYNMIPYKKHAHRRDQILCLSLKNKGKPSQNRQLGKTNNFLMVYRVVYGLLSGTELIAKLSESMTLYIKSWSTASARLSACAFLLQTHRQNPLTGNDHPLGSGDKKFNSWRTGVLSTVLSTVYIFFSKWNALLFHEYKSN